MKICSTGDRLKQIMEARNLRQVDILNSCKPFCEKYNVKLGRNDLSQYINNKIEPKQDKLTVLAKGLNVDEVWLMGYNVDSTGQYTIFDIADEIPPECKSAFIPSYKDIETEANKLFDQFKKSIDTHYPELSPKELSMIQDHINITYEEVEFIKKYRKINKEFQQIINQTMDTAWNVYKENLKNE